MENNDEIKKAAEKAKRFCDFVELNEKLITGLENEGYEWKEICKIINVYLENPQEKVDDEIPEKVKKLKLQKN